MHNLFLGSGKNVLKSIWMKRNIINESQFEIIQSRIDKIVCPSDIGRIPNKIRSGFASFTADQYKNWIVHFSLLALRDIVTEDDLECWRHLILACRYLCSNEICYDHIRIADGLLMQFCRRIERMYGKDIITPNMHMHAHLCECLYDYGPCHVFWLFSFERYNGILESLPNNNRSIEVQVMKRFMENMYMTADDALPEEYREDFESLFSHKRVVGTLSDNFLTRPTSNINLSIYIDLEHVKLPKYSSRGIFTQFQVNGLRRLYSELSGLSQSEINVPSAFVKFKQVTINGKQIGTQKSRFSSSSLVMAMQKPEAEERPVAVKYFAKHTVSFKEVSYTFLLFYGWWHKPHAEKNLLGKPVTVWESDIYESDDCYSVIPVQAIKRRTISLVDKISTGETVLFVCPCVNF